MPAEFCTAAARELSEKDSLEIKVSDAAITEDGYNSRVIYHGIYLA